MVDLLKAFGRGILYVLLFPFFILGLAIFAVVGLLAFIFQLIKSVIYFFTGQKFFPELPEDRELRLMREAAEAAAHPAPANPNPQPVYQEQTYQQPQVQPQTNIVFEEYNEDDFLEEPKEEQPKEEVPIIEETPVQEAVSAVEEKPEPEQVDELGEDSLMSLLDNDSNENDESSDETVIETSINQQEEEEEELEIYRPKETNYTGQIEEDDENTGYNGVHIGFDEDE